MWKYGYILQVFLTVINKAVLGEIINLVTGKEVSLPLESGFINASSFQTHTITTSKNFTNAVVYLSSIYAHDLRTSSVPVQARVVDFNPNKGVNEVKTFSIKLIWPSNSTCISEWYSNDHININTIFSISWLVGEEGAYSVNGVQIEFVTAVSYAFAFTQKIWPHPFGSLCHYPKEEGSNDYAPGAVFTIQSNNNNDQYMQVRAGNWFQSSETKCNYAWKGGRTRLYPHDGYSDLDSISNETVGIFLYDARSYRSMDCMAGSYFEIGVINDIQSVPTEVPINKVIDTSSGHSFGVFGSVLTLTGGDSASLQSYSSSEHPGVIYSYLQEDKCVDEETTHAAEILSYAFVTLTQRSDCSESPPIVTEFTLPPSSAPSSVPTLQPSSTNILEDAISHVKKHDNLLLAILLPIAIIMALSFIRFLYRKIFHSPSSYLDEGSEHSTRGLNMVDTNVDTSDDRANRSWSV